MPAVPADLSIDARWIVPMTARGRALENHTLVVRDGRILDLLPSADAAARYAPTVTVERPGRNEMPGGEGMLRCCVGMEPASRRGAEPQHVIG